MASLAGIALAFGTGALVSHAATPSSCTITLIERTGVTRANECVVFGVPVPRDWQVTNTNQFGLIDADGTAIPAQFEILARWAGAAHNTAAPARWVLVSYLASLPANSSSSVFLHHSGTSVAPAVSINISTAEANRITVDTGAAQFKLNTSAFNLFEQVTVSGQTLLDPQPATTAIAYLDLDGTDIVPGGSPDLSARATSATIERAGPLFSVIKVEGSILNGAAQAVLDYTARLHFYANSTEARLDFTVENNHPVIPDDMGQPSNAHRQGAVNSVYIGDLRLKLRLRNTGGALHVLAEQSTVVDNPAATVRLFQGSSGMANWNVYTGTPGWPGYEESAHPRLQSYCTNGGYGISYSGSLLTGDQSQGWMTAYRDGGPLVMATVRNFWQNYPKAIEADADGSLSVVLFPNGSQFHHNFRVGEEKTHSVLLHFGTGSATHANCAQAAAAFNSPLRGVVASTWHTNAAALGETPTANTNEWPLYERYVRTAFEPNPDFDPATDDPSFGNSTLQARAIDRYEFYGWQDYGDVPLDYEAFDDYCAGQMNLKYWFTFGMLAQFCRSSDLHWLDLAYPAARHLSDLDILHVPDEGAWHWSHGAYFGHSEHDERGNLNPNRNFNSPSVDLVFGIPDLLLAYYLTGERRFRDVALEALAGNKNMSEFSDFTAPVPSRERANLIFGYLEGYRETGDARWLTELTNIVGQTANLSNKSWLTNPGAYGTAHPGESVKMFCLSQTLWTMGKYLDFCGEYGLPDSFGVATALLAYCDFTINYTMSDVGTDASATIYEYFFDGSDPSYLDHNNWALVMADAMAYTYKYSGAARFIQAAARLYNTGVTDPLWPGDPPVYIDTKSLVNSINWGLVYMNQTRTQAPDPDPDPAVGPSIYANGASGTVTINYGLPVFVTVSLNAGEYAGIEADWWVVAYAYSGQWYYLDSAMQWTEFNGDLAWCQPAYQGALFNLASTTVLDEYVLPPGGYNFYFAVDQRDDILNYPAGPILYDTVTVVVQ